MATNRVPLRTAGSRPLPAGTTNRSARIMWGLLVSLVVLAVGVVAIRNWPTAVLPDDPDVLKSVDALFTAVTSKNPSRLDHCARRLGELKAQSRMEPKTWACLESIMHQASAGDWRGASRKLHNLMLRPTSQK